MGDLLNEPLPTHQPTGTVRPSACPGLLRIVPALDGGICRIKLPGGVLDASQAEAVAQGAERFAHGVIEATNRSNLQIRGIGARQAELIEWLLAAGLGPTHPAGDDVRNLMLSPTAGIDPDMLFDTRPLAAQILSSLQSQPRFHELSAKFAVQLDGGEALAMLTHHHDLWLSPTRLEGQTWLAFGLAGSPADEAALGAVPLARGLDLVMEVLDLFLQAASPEQTRMRHLLAELGSKAFTQRLGQPTRPVAFRRHSAGSSHLGAYPQRQSGLAWVGAAPALGRLDPAMLRGAANLAREFGDGSLRLTPWQSLLLPGIAEARAGLVARQLAQLGMLVEADAPLARMIACTGSAGCAKGLADTKGDAARLAMLLKRPGAPLSVHLTGCGRSCAVAHVAPATLLAADAGHYDLYFRDPRQPGFGALQARNLSLDAAAAWLDGCSRSDTDD